MTITRAEAETILKALQSAIEDAESHAASMETCANDYYVADIRVCQANAAEWRKLATKIHGAINEGRG